KSCSTSPTQARRSCSRCRVRTRRELPLHPETCERAPASRAALRPLCLKIQFQTQLYFARRRSQKCNRAERAATENGIRRSEVWVIKYIEGFKSKFQASTFPQTRKREFLKERHGNIRSEEHTSELQSRFDLVCRLL